MKYLVLIAVIFIVLWLMRSSREAQHGQQGRASGAGRAAPPPPQDMVECPVCHVHLPRTDALPGPGGRIYCCAEHSQRGH
jgi:uncharacterized protein